MYTLEFSKRIATAKSMGKYFSKEREFELGNNDLPLGLAHQLLCKEKAWFEHGTLISKKQSSCYVTVF